MQEPGHEGARKSIAIVGTGMAGLVTAYLFNQDPQRRFDVELFEVVRLENARLSLPVAFGLLSIVEQTRLGLRFLLPQCAFYAISNGVTLLLNTVIPRSGM